MGMGFLGHGAEANSLKAVLAVWVWACWASVGSKGLLAQRVCLKGANLLDVLLKSYFTRMPMVFLSLCGQ